MTSQTSTRGDAHARTKGTSNNGVEKSPSCMPIVRPRKSAENLSARQHDHQMRFRIAFSFSVKSSRPLCVHLSGLRFSPRSSACG